MASISAIAKRRGEALERINTLSNQIAQNLGIEAKEVSVRSGQDVHFSQMVLLETVADNLDLIAQNLNPKDKSKKK